MPESPTHNRREYFRVEDQLGIECRRVEPGQDVHDLFEDQTTLGLHQELRRVDQEVRQQLATLSEQDRNLAAVLKTFNHKLDTLARIMAFEQKPLQPQQWHSVTLSEGGVAFALDDPELRPGDRLGLRLTLLPELQRVSVKGSVVEKAAEPDPRMVHVAFIELSDTDRQVIARHVLRVQARQRQESRQLL